MEVLARVDVFGNAHEIESVDLPNGRSSEYCPAADKERPAPPVAPSLDRMIEQVLLVGNTDTGAESPLENILVVKMVRRLHKTHPMVGKQWNRLAQRGGH